MCVWNYSRIPEVSVKSMKVQSIAQCVVDDMLISDSFFAALFAAHRERWATQHPTVSGEKQQQSCLTPAMEAINRRQHASALKLLQAQNIA